MTTSAATPAHALIGADTGVTDVVAAQAPWLFLAMRGFAGPSTDWRAVALADAPEGVEGVRAGDTFEVGRGGAWRPRTRDAGVVVASADGEHGARVLVPSAGGVTLGEVLDETIAQKARIDGSYAVHLVAALAPTFLRRVLDGGGGAVSVDNVLIGFDGSVHTRADVPWWPARRVPRLPSGMMAPTDDAESVRLFGELVAELFASRRFHALVGGGARGSATLSFPGHEGPVRSEARALVEMLLERPIAPDVEELWHEIDLPGIDDVARRIDGLRRLVDPVPPLALATFVRHLFPERARREDVVTEQIAALTRSGGSAP